MKTTITVTLKVGVDVGGKWGVDCTLDQIHKQATQEAIERIRKRLQGDPTLTFIQNDSVEIKTTVP